MDEFLMRWDMTGPEAAAMQVGWRDDAIEVHTTCRKWSAVCAAGCRGSAVGLEVGRGHSGS
jgi:hypothetical protein